MVEVAMMMVVIMVVVMVMSESHGPYLVTR
jgi:hypothetical protein